MTMVGLFGVVWTTFLAFTLLAKVIESLLVLRGLLLASHEVGDLGLGGLFERLVLKEGVLPCCRVTIEKETKEFVFANRLKGFGEVKDKRIYLFHVV